MRLALLTTISLTALTPSGVWAQQSAGETTSDAPAQGLGDIVVTAQRVTENAQRAAVAIDVVTADDLLQADIKDASRLSELSPAVTIQRTSTGNFAFVRGVGNFTVAPVSDPAVAFNYDGVYIGRPSSTSGSFFDLQRVEVLKGPQGTLYGRNATGGAINVIPQKPVLGKFSGYATGSYGSFDAVALEGAINIPMGPDGALRASAAFNDRDGYLEDGTNDDHTASIRLQMMANLTPSLTVRLAADYADHGGMGSGVSYLGLSRFVPGTGYVFVPSNLPLSEGVLTPASQAFRQTAVVAPAFRTLGPITDQPFRDNQFSGINAEIEYDTGAGTLTVVPAFRNSKLSYLGTSGFLFRTNETDDQYSIEARFNGARIGIFDYTIGGLFYNEQIDSRQRINFSSLQAIVRDELETTSYAAFARITAHVADNLRLVGGARYTRDRKTFVENGANAQIRCTNVPPSCPSAPLIPLVNSFNDLPFAFPSNPTGGPYVQPLGRGAVVARINRAQDNKLTNQRVTWRAAVEYDIGSRSLLYASIETGFRSGGFSGAAGFETYDPEYLTAYTIGSKSRFFDNRLQLNVEGFLWKYKDQQVNFVGLDINGQPANQTQNIGRSTIKGVEVETQFLITPTTLLRADAQYLDSQVDSFIYTASAAGAPPLTGCKVSPAGPGRLNVDCSGFPGYNSPKWTINLGAQQTIGLGDYDLVLSADTQYKSKRYLAFEYIDQVLAPSFWSSNARITFAEKDSNWSISGFVRNIENNRNLVFISNVGLSNLLVASTTPPRTWGIQGSFKF